MDILNEKIEGLVKKAEKSGMPYGILKKVYDRGMAAWRTGHRPGTTPQQWAFARVNSFVTKSSGTWGGADKDLAAKARGSMKKKKKTKKESLWANIHKKRQRIKRGSGERMRKKGEKGAPTAAQMQRAKGESVTEDSKMGKQSDSQLKDLMKKMRDLEKKDPKKPSTQHMIKRIEKEMKKRKLTEVTSCEALYDHVITEAEYQGKKVKLNDPIRTSENPNKKFKVYVKNDKGKVVVVRFGDPNMSIKRDDPERRKNFRARHNCDNPGPKYKARYWSCFQWRAGAKVDN